MSIDRITRVNELLRREIGEALFKIVHESRFDFSAVTITHVQASRNLRHARVLVSIRDHENERDEILAVLRRHRGEIQQNINKDLSLKFTPQLMFTLDTSVEHGDKILHLIDELGIPEDTEPRPGDEPAPDKDRPEGSTDW